MQELRRQLVNFVSGIFLVLYWLETNGVSLILWLCFVASIYALSTGGK